MIGRMFLAAAALAVGIALASFIPRIPEALHDVIGLGARPSGSEALADEHKARNENPDTLPAIIKLDRDQIESTGIEVAPVQDGTLSHRIIIPGTIVPNPDRIAHVSVKLSASVTELRKKVGDRVAAGEVLAVLESRDIASAKSEYLAARLNSDLQRDLYDRDKALWDRHVLAEQQLLRSRGAASQSRMTVDITRQKLIALGLTESEITVLPNQPEATLPRLEILAPISGRVVDRKADLGDAVGRDNLDTELFIVADLDRVWVDLAVGPSDLPLIVEGQTVAVSAHGLARRATGKIVFISPLLDRDTHSARVIAEISNPDGNWRPGSLITASVAIEERKSPLTVPVSAVQSINNEQLVFVRTSDGFEKRAVSIGQSDERLSEITSGVRAGEIVAVTNTFALKAELLKSSFAED